jgi:hypothetical protein
LVLVDVTGMAVAMDAVILTDHKVCGNFHSSKVEERGYARYRIRIRFCANKGKRATKFL